LSMKAEAGRYLSLDVRLFRLKKEIRVRSIIKFIKSFPIDAHTLPRFSNPAV
jgi:hypothetical protein